MLEKTPTEPTWIKQDKTKYDFHYRRKNELNTIRKTDTQTKEQTNSSHIQANYFPESERSDDYNNPFCSVLEKWGLSGAYE